MIITDEAEVRDVKAELEDVPMRGLRDRLAALATMRDAARGWTADEYEYIAERLLAYTDAVMHELAKREQGENYVPYPHPVGEAPGGLT